MFWLKQVFLWIILVIAVTPLSFVLIPLIFIGGLTGAIAIYVNRFEHVHHPRNLDTAK